LIIHPWSQGVNDGEVSGRGGKPTTIKTCTCNYDWLFTCWAGTLGLSYIPSPRDF
jgi:hypothetical protein